MKIIQPNIEILYITPNALDIIERAGRQCWKSDINQDNQIDFIQRLIKLEHLTPIEFADIICKITCSRACSHQLVRHRLLSICQESQRYCNYSKEKFGCDIKFIKPIVDYDKKNNQPIYLQNSPYKLWELSCIKSELAYFDLINHGCKAEISRYVLNESVATELQFKCNFRELLHILKLRTSPKAQAEIRYLIINLQSQIESQEYSCIMSNL